MGPRGTALFKIGNRAALSPRRRLSANGNPHFPSLFFLAELSATREEKSGGGEAPAEERRKLGGEEVAEGSSSAKERLIRDQIGYGDFTSEECGYGDFTSEEIDAAGRRWPVLINQESEGRSKGQEKESHPRGQGIEGCMNPQIMRFQSAHPNLQQGVVLLQNAKERRKT